MRTRISRRKFLGSTAGAALASGLGADRAEALLMAPGTRSAVGKGCYVERGGERLVLGNESLRWQVDVSSGVHADLVENHLTGERISLGKGPEVGLRLSAAQQRLELLDWKEGLGGKSNEAPDREMGFANGFHRAEFDDREWKKITSPWELGYGGFPFEGSSPDPTRYNWFRVPFELPSASGQPVCLGLGGYGIYEYGELRVFVNGQLIGQRSIRQEWTDPGLFTLNPGDPGYAALKFGQSNVVAVQAWSLFDCRPARLKELDRDKHYATVRTLALQDQFVSVGPAFQDVVVTGVRKVNVLSGSGDRGRVQIVLDTTAAPGDLVVNYEWTADEPALRKWLEFKNTSDRELLLLDVDLGDYRISVPCSEGFRGFPVYLKDEVFCSIAHPAGVAQGNPGRVRVRHFPGRYLQPGETFVSNQAVFGVAGAGQARKAFWEYIMRRSVRRTTEGMKPSLHYDGLGAAWGRPAPWGKQDPVSEEIVMSVMDRMEQLKKDLGLQFDYFWIDAGWSEEGSRGLKFKVAGFPNGPQKMIQRVNDLGMRFGMYPGAAPHDPSALRDFKNAVSHDILNNHAQGLKFDGAGKECFSPEHAVQRLHLPGKYSTEFVQDVAIDAYNYARKLGGDLWVFLYWGHDSPWWLLHGYTTFDHGLFMEMETPSMYPTLYERDSITLGMDQVEQYHDDVPPPGRDSMGVWTTTGWAPFGQERWLQNTMLDICRGPAVLHIWGDVRKFTPADAEILSRLAKILKAHPDCLLNSQRILGDPRKGQPYGYACSNGERAFVVVSNPTWLDQRIELRLDQSLGLDRARETVLHRHAPKPARLVTQHQSVWRSGDSLSWYIRPFEVVLVELAPLSKAPALRGPWDEEQLSVDSPSPPAQQIALTFDKSENLITHIQGEIGPYPSKAILAVVLHMTKDGRDWSVANLFSGRHESCAQTPVPGFILATPYALKPFTFLPDGSVGDKPVGPDDYTVTPAIRSTCWVVLKIPLQASESSRRVDLLLAEGIPPDVTVERKAFLIPQEH